MTRTAASTARKPATKAAPKVAATDDAPVPETAKPDDEAIAKAADDVAATAAALDVTLGGGEPIVSLEAPDAEVTPDPEPAADAPAKEAAPAASTAPLEPPAPREEPEPPAAPPTPDQLGAKTAAMSSQKTLRVIDDETGEVLTEEHLDDLFVPVTESATVVESSRRLVREVSLPPYGATTRVLLVAKGVTLPEVDAQAIKDLVTGTAG